MRSPVRREPLRIIEVWLPPTETLNDLLLRGLNIAVAIIGLVLTLPVILVIAIAVKLSSPGPVFYTQERVGLDQRRNADGRRPGPALPDRRNGDRGGRVFRIYKFRTMRPSDASIGQVWASDDDPRITGIGRLLRRYRLDELPQFINVIKGDMNIVGPRPEQPRIFSELREQVDQYPMRQRVLPGITGWAQVNHGYDETLEDVKTKVHLDLQYIEGRSVSKDLVIMAKTLPVMILKRGSK
jgi:lipopolysaccharide/colanic/teichoic acid biosynthesis glycosyltransferase